MIQHCPVCGNEAVQASGDKSNKVLIIGEQPGEEELAQGRPFVGPSGGVFRKELSKVGLDMSEMRVCNLWLHLPNKDERCFKLGYDMVMDEAKGMKAILLVGSEVVNTFTNYSVSKVNGLRVDSLFSCKNVIACINPAIVFQPGKGIGEIRFAMKNFREMLKGSKIL